MKKILLSVLLLLIALPGFSQVQTSWTNTFTINVFRQAIPSIIDPNPTITVIEGSTGSSSVTLTNAGNISTSFSVSNPVPETFNDLNVKWERDATEWVEFSDPGSDRYPDQIDTNSQFTAWNASTPLTTESMPFGFTFRFLETDYTSFAVSVNGWIRLGSSSTYLDAFWSTDLSINTNNVRYLKETNRVVVSWEGAETGTLSGLRFQVHMYKNGEVRYLYKTMDGATTSDANVGFTLNGTPYVVWEYTPLNDNTDPLASDSSLLITQAYSQWVTLSPETGGISVLDSTPLTFSADASGQSLGSYPYSFPVTWGDGSTETINLTVEVVAANPELSAPTDVLFNGPAGIPTEHVITFTNTGDVALNYSIVDTAAAQEGYEWTNTTYNWQSIASDRQGMTEFIPEDPGEGFSELIPLEFGFPFFGTIYTNLSIGVNGGISLGEARGMPLSVTLYETTSWGALRTYPFDSYLYSGQPSFNENGNYSYQYSPYYNEPVCPHFIAPFWRDLSYANGSRILYGGSDKGMVITWEHVSGGGGSDQTFQVILYKTGQIKFQYKQLEGTNYWITTGAENEAVTNGIAGGIGIHDTSAGYDDTTLVYEEFNKLYGNTGTVTYEEVVSVDTNTIIGESDRDGIIYATVTNTIATYMNPLTEKAFMYTPKGGGIITVNPTMGSLDVDETTDITITGDARNLPAGSSATANFSIAYNGKTSSMDVQFDVDALSPATAQADTDGDGQKDVDELIAGTDALDADSTFSVNLDGSRKIVWTAPKSGLSLNRNYTLWFATDLSSEWQKLVTLENQTTYTDNEHNDLPVIFYKVTVN